MADPRGPDPVYDSLVAGTRRAAMLVGKAEAQRMFVAALRMRGYRVRHRRGALLITRPPA